MSRASEGEVLVEVLCRCGGQLVRKGAVPEWRCRCHRKELHGEVVLGPGGTFPPGWRPTLPERPKRARR